MFDWISFLDDHGVPYWLHGSNISRGWGAINCPHHASDHEHKFGFSLEHGGSKCWKCGNHHIFDTIMALAGCTKPEAMKLRSKYDTDGIVYTEQGESRVAPDEVSLPGKDFTKYEIAYIQKRGIYDRVESCDLRSGGICGFFSHRIVIPIRFRGRIVSATGRSISKSAELRYLTLPADKEIIQHKHLLYQEDMVKTPYLFVVEGVLDAVRFGPGCVSTFGTSVTQQQLLKLAKYERVYLGFDNDEAGRMAADKLSFQLSSLGVDTISITWDNEAKDIGDMSEQDIEYIRRELCL